MNKKEINEIRRRFSPDKGGISKIYGCYVNTNREIIAYLEESMALMPEFEAEKYCSLLKKALSGTQEKNLLDLVFTTAQVADSEEHRLLMGLRESRLEDRELREKFYQTVIDNLEMPESNYLILLASDVYDVPVRGSDDELDREASDTVFQYFVCCICPVKDGREELAYFVGDNEFHSSIAAQVVGAPELGFLFPAFDDRAANLYDVLFYAKNPDQIHHEFIDGVFHTEAPMTSGEQKETFETVLAETLEEDCSYQVVQAVHEQLCSRIEEHKETRDPEPLDLSPREIGAILQSSGVPEERVEAFQEKCGENFGPGAALNPANIIDSRRFEVTLPQIKITVDPACSYLIEPRVIDGQRYLLIPVDDRVELNGVPVMVDRGEEQE